MAKQAKVDAMTLWCLCSRVGSSGDLDGHGGYTSKAEQRCEVKMKAISLCCLVQRSEIVRRWRKRARRKRKRQALCELSKRASRTKVEQEQARGQLACGAVQRGLSSPAGIDTETAFPWGMARGAIRLRVHTLARIATETAVPHG